VSHASPSICSVEPLRDQHRDEAQMGRQTGVADNLCRQAGSFGGHGCWRIRSRTSASTSSMTEQSPARKSDALDRSAADHLASGVSTSSVVSPPRTGVSPRALSSTTLSRRAKLWMWSWPGLGTWPSTSRINTTSARWNSTPRVMRTGVGERHVLDPGFPCRRFPAL
jgi:hypothetical protein